MILIYMSNMNLGYVFSQVLIIITYILICRTYFLKNRNKILITNIIAHIFQGLSFLLLNGFTGSAMQLVYIFRDSFFVIDEKNREDNKLTKRDFLILLLFLLIILILTIFTYDGFGSLLSVFATIISTIAIWQKKTKYYKMLGIPVSVLWVLYYIFLRSIFAIVLESILLISIIIGFILEIKNNKYNNTNI